VIAVNRQATQRQLPQPQPLEQGPQHAEAQGAQGQHGGAGYVQAGLPDWAKDRVGEIFGRIVEDWPTSKNLITVPEIIPLLSELVSKHGEVSENTPSWVQRLNTYVANQKTKRKKQKKDHVDSSSAADVAARAQIASIHSVLSSAPALVQDSNAMELDLDDTLDLGSPMIPIEVSEIGEGASSYVTHTCQD
jgi:hypothetical protein